MLTCHTRLLPRAAGDPGSLVALAQSSDSSGGETNDEDVAGVLALEDMNTKEDDPPAGSAEDNAGGAEASGMVAIEGILSECKDIFFAALSKHESASAAAAAAATAEPRAALRAFGYFAFLGVAEAHRRRRVGDALVGAAVEALRKDGFSYGVAFCTSRKSAALFAARGFARWGGVSYQAFALADGSHPFASLPVDECAVMVLDLRAAA
jgi:GNAT superfamily N-acetyltransferase